MADITNKEYSCFNPGTRWNDQDGQPIQAHGGGVLFWEGKYYWYGENKDAPTEAAGACGYRTDVVGISCYTSDDLYNWTYEGLVLSAEPEDINHDLHPSKIMERPKVIYNSSTRQFVMWMHIDNSEYTLAKAGISVSASPTGPFRYLGSIFPNGADSRDLTLFQDDNGKAYLIHSSDWNKTLLISELNSDYTNVTGNFSRAFIDQYREAPAVFKRGGTYYMITSGCTGWAPNIALYAEATSMMGLWGLKDNPCQGPDARKTFHAQSTFVLPLQGKQDAFIFMADIWIPNNLSESKYVWLPISFDEDGIQINWSDQWDLSVFDHPETGT
ncbi:glycoside hydrolase family 43 protein [Paenibacillus sp. GCM10012307]|uniref:Family 43 glycosylhydrolase n=1 Tax=Paenibacillus roseus TaxID=2798579 RepID=A0A934JBC2_9BACL|nr:glycoside hydrolase family 43 protein [Paenibacillus roseus]MBJ6364026.1 family 43 glycosylhydrolase [Paenibacillus roseus]